jgi:PAS domain-containing protein
MRALPDGDRIPVMMTGLEDAAAIEWASEGGAIEFEIKPLNFDVLVHRVRYLLRSARTANALRASETRLGLAQRLARLGHYDWNLRTGVVLCSSVAGEISGLTSGTEVLDLAELLAGTDPDDGPPARRLLADSFRRSGQCCHWISPIFRASTLVLGVSREIRCDGLRPSELGNAYAAVNARAIQPVNPESPRTFWRAPEEMSSTRY